MCWFRPEWTWTLGRDRCLMDTPRASARSALEQLTQDGITRMIIALSGDNHASLDAVPPGKRPGRGVGAT